MNAFRKQGNMFYASLSYRCKSILTSVSSMIGLQKWVKRSYLHNLAVLYWHCTIKHIHYFLYLSPVSCVWWSVLKDLLPVLLTGAGPLSAIDYLGNPRYQACGNISQAVSHHTAAVRRVPGVVAVGPRQQVCHGHEKVVEGNANDHIVIDPNVGGHHHHAIAHTWEKKTGREPTEEKH